MQLPEVLGTDRFRKDLERERMRADRTSCDLSLLLLDVSGVEWRDVPLHEPLLVFLHRVRLSDEVGWYDRRTVGVLLPDTGADGAHQVATDLQSLLESFGVLGSWRVYTYPGTWDASTHERPRSGRPSAPVRSEATRRAVRAPREQDEAAPETRPDEVREPQAEPDAKPATEAARVEAVAQPLGPLFHRRPSFLKRSFDIAGSAIGLLLFSPVMLLAAALVWGTSPGPVIFRQTRVGLGGRRFDFFKFRTMYLDAEERKKELMDQNEATGPVFKMRNDPRMTPIGKVLRKSSIDELPQLWNVFRGDMSLVGPRPPVPREVEVYDPWQRRRLEVPGGLTCIWQVSGRSEIAFEEWVRMDIQYGRRMGFLYDLGILLQTVPAVLTGRGAR